MVNEVIFVKRVAIELCRGIDRSIALYFKDVAPLTDNEVRQFGNHIGTWRTEKAAFLGSRLWEHCIGLFISWVDNLIDNIQNYENNDSWKSPRESGLEVKITLLFSSKLRRCCNIHLNILAKSTNFYIVNIHNIRMILIVLVLFTYFKNYFDF